jgi:ComF family protein
MGRQYIDPSSPLLRLHLLLTRLLERAPRLTIATQCAVCRGWGGDRLCTPCRERFMPLRPRCMRCALRVPAGVATCGRCLTHPPPVARALAAMDYAHPWDRLIARFKFQAALDLAPAFARCLAAAWRASGDAVPELIVPVPLSDARLKERGYNQSWELARRLARRIGSVADAALLLRIKDSPHQLALPVDRRAANVAGVFAVEPTRQVAVRGRRIVVLDDVMTTGATAHEAARVLRQAGAAQVDLWMLARTPAPRE